MDTKITNKIFGVHQYAIRLNGADMTHEESLIAPQPGGNCANWVLGHIIVSRGDIVALLGGEKLWTDEQAAPYLRGSRGFEANPSFLPWPSLLTELDKSQEVLAKEIASASPEKLAESLGKDTVAERLAFLQFHEGYHVGQLGLLRRLVGRAGQIG